MTPAIHRRLEVPFPMNWGYSPIRLSGLAGYSDPSSIATVNQITAITSSGVQIAGISQSGAPISTKIEASSASAMGAAASVIVQQALMAGTAVPVAGIVLLAAAGVAQLLAIMGVGSGCGQTCVISSQYADRAEQVLSQNILNYFLIPAPRTVSQQSSALVVFDTVWNDLRQQCGNAQLGDAGKRCITDRQSGACTWKQTSDSVLLGVPGEPQPGACWNWFNGYRDPIANDLVVPDGSTNGTEIFYGPSVISGISNSDLFLYAGAAVLLLGVMGSVN